ncbi:hypothetical protein FA95DRAFT_1566656 [Auriscalpium vulgare]|uniref:Uncharacterized protein n=1 Tax=Auriscalpium vulgare TaxID=40419 RepID=A0ACB8R7Z9_9AGAM|nr:hypothetical protein FA95DRAFT_1566656 [Auriscalpium vulgare]
MAARQALASQVSEAALFQQKGTELYGKKAYQAAILEFTRALAFDSENAVLYSNRAACYLALKNNDKCLDDAHKLDPTYEKGWWRRAEACQVCNDPAEELYSWLRALSAMGSPENQTTAQGKLRMKFLTEIVRLRVTAPPVGATDSSGALVFNPPLGRTPWEAAIVKYHKLTGEQRSRSCCLVIMESYVGLKTGIEALKKADPFIPTKTVLSWTQHGFIRPSDSLRDLTNSLTSDMRTVRWAELEAPEHTGMLQRMIENEMRTAAAPDPSQKFNVMTMAFRDMLKQNGWNRVRPSVTITVRCLIVRGHMAMNMRRDYETAYTVLSKAQRIIEWGRTEWEGVSTDDRGTIFSDTFYAAVASMALVAFEAAYTHSHGRSRRFRKEELIERADTLIKYTLSIPRPASMKAVSSLAFVIYPEAQAHSTKGLAFAKHVEYKLCEDAEEKKTYLRHAVDEYMKAAEIYPTDEERHAQCLYDALMCLFRLRAPLRETMPLMDRICIVTPEIVELWEYSELMQTRLLKSIRELVVFAQRVTQQGFAPDAFVQPPWLQNEEESEEAILFIRPGAPFLGAYYGNTIF